MWLPNCQPQKSAGLATNDQRMEQVVMDARGHLWGALTTTFDMTVPAALQTAGVEWVKLTPLKSTADTSSTLVHDGITGSHDIAVFFPSVSLPRPEDGFAAYDPGYLRPRWGDYSSTVVAPDGSTWFAGETTSIQRTTLANWSTELFDVPPSG